jgi:hypothetical protein
MEIDLNSPYFNNKPASKQVRKLLRQEVITQADMDALSTEEVNELTQKFNYQYNELQGDERERYYRKMEQVISIDTRSQIWEYNHQQITNAMAEYMEANGVMPTRTQLANITGLSRQTIHKHLRDYSTHPQYKAQLEQFRFMAHKVLAAVCNKALAGDMQAAKLLFTLTGIMPTQQVNPTVQINDTQLSQETVELLSPEQKVAIEMIVKQGDFLTGEHTERQNAVTAKTAKGMQRKIPPRVQQYINRQGTYG